MVANARSLTKIAMKDGYAQAAAWTLLGALFFSGMNAVAKYLGISVQNGDDVMAEAVQTIPVLQITFARYAVAALAVLPFVLVRPSRFQMSSPARYLGRSIAGFGGIALMLLAIQTVPLASATAIGFTCPVFALVFSVLFLGERVPNLRWVAAALGLFGALIIASPGSGVPIVGAIIAFAAAAFMGAEIVGVRWLAQTSDGQITILFYSNLMGAVISGAFMLSNFVWPTSDQLLTLSFLGIVAILGQACFIRAARQADANFLAPFFYASLIYAAVIGYVVFDETLSFAVSIGCLTIFASALLTLKAGRN